MDNNPFGPKRAASITAPAQGVIITGRICVKKCQENPLMCGKNPLMCRNNPLKCGKNPFCGPVGHHRIPPCAPSWLKCMRGRFGPGLVVGLAVEWWTPPWPPLFLRGFVLTMPIHARHALTRPMPATASHSSPQSATASHSQPQPATTSHSQP